MPSTEIRRHTHAFNRDPHTYAPRVVQRHLAGGKGLISALQHQLGIIWGNCDRSEGAGTQQYAAACSSHKHGQRVGGYIISVAPVVSKSQRQKGWGKGQRKRMVSIGLPPPVAVFASPVPEPSIRCHQGHEGSRWRGDVVGNAWGEGGGGGQGPGKGEGGGGATLNFKPTGCQ